MSKPVKLFIVEGETREKHFVEEMTKCFFSHGRYETEVITLPAKQNIYMLYQILEQDSFQSDIVEILRDTVIEAKEVLDGINRQDIDEVYLFFDYDIHQDNLKHTVDSETPEEIIRKLLATFDNETENGKLYLSYPMVEALYDCRETICQAFSSCFIDLNDIGNYKQKSGEGNPLASSHMDFLTWKNVINVFYLRINCLFNISEFSISEYRSSITPSTIFEIENELVNQNKHVFVLSAFPEFLLDNFKSNFWNTMTPNKHLNYINCPKLLPT